MTTTKKLTYTGGFHNSANVSIRVPANIDMDDLWYNLSDHQRKKLDHHFCGISDCTCGGFCRAELVDK